MQVRSTLAGAVQEQHERPAPVGLGVIALGQKQQVLQADGVTPATASLVTVQVGGQGGGTQSVTTDLNGNFGFPVVPDVNMIYTGWSDGNCSNRISPDLFADPNSSNLTVLTSWPMLDLASKYGIVTIFSSEGTPSATSLTLDEMSNFFPL